MSVTRKYAVVFFLAVLASCGARKDVPALPRGPVPLSSLTRFDNEVHPLANGDAYLINQIDDQLFFLSHGLAVRVDAVDLRGLDPTIYPLANGAAYLVSSDRKTLRLYYLVRERATEVKEVAHLPSVQHEETASREGFLWAQAQVAISAHRRAERNATESTADAPDHDDFQ